MVETEGFVNGLRVLDPSELPGRGHFVTGQLWQYRLRDCSGRVRNPVWLTKREEAGGGMARKPVHDERQTDLFGAPPPPVKPARRAAPPKPAREEVRVPEPVSLGTLGTKATRSEIDELLDGLPDQELAYLAVEATRHLKRRLARGQGRGLRSRAGGRSQSPLGDALRRIGGELMEFEDPGDTW
jgi:hypothetical protein